MLHRFRRKLYVVCCCGEVVKTTRDKREAETVYKRLSCPVSSTEHRASLHALSKGGVVLLNKCVVEGWLTESSG